MFHYLLTKLLDKDSFFNIFERLINPSDLKPIVPPKNANDKTTIDPDGVMSKIYEIIMPSITAETANEIESSAVCLKLLPYIIDVTLGITNRAEINNIPTNCIDVTTVIPARKINR